MNPTTATGKILQEIKRSPSCPGIAVSSSRLSEVSCLLELHKELYSLTSSKSAQECSDCLPPFEHYFLLLLLRF